MMALRRVRLGSAVFRGSCRRGCGGGAETAAVAGRGDDAGEILASVGLTVYSSRVRQR